MAPKTPRYSNVTTATRESITFDTADPRYKLARKVDTGSGSYGSTSPFRDPRRLSASADTNNRFRGTDPGFGRGSWNWTGDGVREASQRSTNKAVTVEARTVPGSTRQTLGNRARVSVANATDRFGKGVSAAKSAAGKGTAGAAGATVQSAASSNAQSAAKSAAASAVSKVVSSSASGGPSVGWYKGGFGVGVSRGGLDLGVGFASVSYNFSNPNESAIGGAFNTLTIKGTQEGCTITLDYQFLGKSYFKETRQADECTTPEPEPVVREPPPPEPDPDLEPGMVTSSTRTTFVNLPENMRVRVVVGSESTWETGSWAVMIGGINYVNNGSGIYDIYREGDYRSRNTYFDPNKLGYPVTGSFELVETTVTRMEEIEFNNMTVVGERSYVTEENELGQRVWKKDENGNYVTTTVPEVSAKFRVKSKVTTYKIIQRNNQGGFLTNISLTPVSWENIVYPLLNGFQEFQEYLILTRDWSQARPATPFLFKTDIGRIRSIHPGLDAPGIGYHMIFGDPRGTGRGRMKYIIRNNTNNPTLPKGQTISTPRTLTEDMNDRQQILIERVYKMLGGDTFWENGLAIPNQLFTPEGEGYTRTKSYNGVAHLLFDTLDHRTPGQVEYKLPNGVEYKSINAQGYFQDLGQNVAETLEETKKKETGNSQVMNYLTRNAFLSNQIFKIVLKTNRIVKALLSFLNVPVDQEVEEVDVPFDMSLGGKLGKKGFGSPKELDDELEKLIQEQLKTDPKGEKIAAEFGNNGKAKITLAKIKESAEGGDFWWFIKQNLR